MAVDIVAEITEEVKLIVEGLYPACKRLDYEYEIEKNNEKGLTDRFGFIPAGASFKEGSALGFTTMEHTFNLILTTDYQNKDDEAPQRAALEAQYAKAHCILKTLQKKNLTLPTSGYRVTLISGISFDAPEHINDNSVVILRTDFNIQYRFRNNI